jgi:MFS transporter, SET family, sugar efflux transporter
MARPAAGPNLVPHKMPFVPVSTTSSGLAKEVIPLAGAIGAYGIFMSFTSTTMSLFLADAVHAAPLLIGLYFVVRGVVAIAVNQATGRLSDRMPDRRVLVGVAGVAGAIGAGCLAVLHAYVLVLATGAVFLGLGGISFAQLYAYTNELAVARQHPVTMFTSLMRTVFSAAWVIGPPIGLFLLAQFGFRVLYVSTAAASLACALLGRWGLRRLGGPEIGDRALGGAQVGGDGARVAGPAGPKPAARGRRRPSLPERTRLLLGVVFLLGTVNLVYGINIGLYVTKDLNLGTQFVGWIAGLSALLEIPVMIAVGRFADRVGRLRVLVGSAMGAVAFFMLLPLAHTAALLLALMLLNAAWTGISLCIPMVMVHDEVPGGAGVASSYYSSATMTASLVAGGVAGVSAAAIGYRGVFWVCAALAVVAVVLLLVRGWLYGTWRHGTWRYGLAEGAAVASEAHPALPG